MILDFVLLADEASLDSAMKLHVRGGAVTHITAASVPFTLDSLAVVMRFFLEAGDRDAARTITVRIRHPDQTSAEVVEGIVPAAGPELLTRGYPEEDATLIVIGRLRNLEFPATGRYEFAFLLDGNEIGQRGIVLVVDPRDDLEAAAPGT